MKSVKRQSGKHSPHKDFKWVAIISGVILSLIFAVFVLPIAYTNYSYYQAEQNNPAKKLAAIMIPFAEENNLTIIEENNHPIFFENGIPSFNYTFQGEDSIDQQYSLIKQYLESKGYKIYTEQSSDVNSKNLQIENIYGDVVSVVISTQASGFKMNIRFISHENTYSQPNPSSINASIIIPFAKNYHLEKLQEISNDQNGFCLHSDPCFTYKYQSNKPINEFNSLLRQYLEQEGYTISNYRYQNELTCLGHQFGKTGALCNVSKIKDPIGKTGALCNVSKIKDPINQGHEFWILEGSKGENNKIFATISDKTYMNKDRDLEVSIAPDKSVLDISFSSNK